MGDTLDRGQVAAFFDELEKDAAGKVIFHNLREMAKRMGKGGFSRGWNALSPTNLAKMPTESGRAMEQAVARTQAAEKALETGAKATTRRVAPLQGDLFAQAGKKLPKMPEYSGETLPGKIRAQLASHLRAGSHLAPEHQVAGGVKGVAERLSRGGWTGEGKITKYVPLGQKSWLTLGSAPQVYDIGRKAVEGRKPGESGIGEDIGTLAGFTLPAIRFGGMPTASLVGSLGGMMAGGALGKRLDQAISPQARQAQPQFTRQLPPGPQEGR